MPYNMNMNDEKAPTRKKLLPEGDRQFKIISAREQTSKSGNKMIVFGIKDKETGYEEETYAVAEPKKRWFLKSILNAVGCKGGDDGNYIWDFKDVVGKDFIGTIEHEDNNYINREGIEVKAKQHRIVEVLTMEEVAWDEDKA